ncbi:SDR family oxidoreductase [Sphingobacterium hungaricum]
MDKLTDPKELRILLTGSNGFLGQKLCDFIVEKTPHKLFCTSKSANRNPKKSGYQFQEIELTELDRLEKLILDFAPTHVIHTAALSSVEVCENNPALCQSVNVDSVDFLASICLSKDIHLTFLSTDFVFDGKNGPYAEEDERQPTNAYGASKLQAELILQNSSCRSAILRTILVYGVIDDKNRSNLVLWAKQKLTAQESINVVSDQYRMPTFVDDLAIACISAAEKNARGIFHISSENLYSVKEVVDQVADFWNLDKNLIHPISAKEIGQETNRPKITGFVLDKAKRELGYRPTSLIESFKLMDEQLKSLTN